MTLNPELNTFENLECYQRARGLRKEISALCKSLPSEEENRLKEQLLHASRKVTADIAEGFSHSRRENQRLCKNARGSLARTLDLLNIALDEEYLPQSEYKRLRSFIESAWKELDKHIENIPTWSSASARRPLSILHSSLTEIYAGLRSSALPQWYYHHVFRWAVVVLYMGAIAFLTLSPGERVSAFTLPIPHFDKLAHAGMHGVLAFLICWALQYRFRHRLWLIYVVIISHIYGAAMEFGQYYMDLGRTFSWGDILANTIGAIIAVSVLGLYREWEKKPTSPETAAAEIGGTQHENTYEKTNRDFSAKRVLDFCAALSGLIILSPLLLFLALMVRYRHGKPIFFRQTRPGMNEQPFELLKFRTMTDERNENGELLPDEQRLTKFGSFLRKSSLDELPELFNVLRGEMSLVGPRPLLTRYLPRYTSEQRRRHEVRPGITGWAQINGRNQLSWEEKFKHDVWYVDNQSFWLDIKIIALTLWKVISRQGISADDHATMPEFMGEEQNNGSFSK